MFNQIQFGKRIQQLRNVKGLTQREVAEQLGVSTTHFTKHERGSSAPSLDLCIQMASFFDVSLDYLLLGEEEIVENPKQIIHRVIQLLTAVEQQV